MAACCLIVQLQTELHVRQLELQEERQRNAHARTHVALLKAMTAVGQAMRGLGLFSSTANDLSAEVTDPLEDTVQELLRMMAVTEEHSSGSGSGNAGQGGGSGASGGSSVSAAGALSSARGREVAGADAAAISAAAAGGGGGAGGTPGASGVSDQAGAGANSSASEGTHVDAWGGSRSDAKEDDRLPGAVGLSTTEFLQRWAKGSRQGDRLGCVWLPR